jgi:hypothetical protein
LRHAELIHAQRRFKQCAYTFNEGSRMKQFIVNVVNSSNWQIIGFMIQETGKKTKLPFPIGKTCDGSCEECGMAHRYVPIYSVDCNAPPFHVFLFAERNGQFAQTAQAALIEPNCRENGTWICAEFPD